MLVVGATNEAPVVGAVVDDVEEDTLVTAVVDGATVVVRSSSCTVAAGAGVATTGDAQASGVPPSPPQPDSAQSPMATSTLLTVFRIADPPRSAPASTADRRAVVRVQILVCTDGTRHRQFGSCAHDIKN
jgi:hypothetical protein